uniref:Uncharacterized protein n=1 Tax=Arundo donax TaxID=35708 RepID=A0A0A9CN93_ARUDO
MERNGMLRSHSTAQWYPC